jgi:hypothetical protein
VGVASVVAASREVSIVVSAADDAASVCDVASLSPDGSTQPTTSRPDNATPAIHGHVRTLFDADDIGGEQPEKDTVVLQDR